MNSIQPMQSAKVSLVSDYQARMPVVSFPFPYTKRLGSLGKPMNNVDEPFNSGYSHFYISLDKNHGFRINDLATAGYRICLFLHNSTQVR